MSLCVFVCVCVCVFECVCAIWIESKTIIALLILMSPRHRKASVTAATCFLIWGCRPFDFTVHSNDYPLHASWASLAWHISTMHTVHSLCIAAFFVTDIFINKLVNFQFCHIIVLLQCDANLLNTVCTSATFNPFLTPVLDWCNIPNHIFSFRHPWPFSLYSSSLGISHVNKQGLPCTTGDTYACLGLCQNKFRLYSFKIKLK